MLPFTSSVATKNPRALCMGFAGVNVIPCALAAAQTKRGNAINAMNEIIFFFIFFVEVGLLNCINCNPVPRGARNHPHEALAASLGLTQGFQLDLVIA